MRQRVGDGLWVRLTFRDDEVFEGVIQNDLLLMGTYLKDTGEWTPTPAYDCERNRWVALDLMRGDDDGALRRLVCGAGVWEDEGEQRGDHKSGLATGH